MGAKVQKLVILVKIHLTFTPHMTPLPDCVPRAQAHARVQTSLPVQQMHENGMLNP